MASSLEFNKIAAAVLTACVVGSLSGVVAGMVVHPHELKEAVYQVPGVEKGEAAQEKGGGAAGPEPIEPLLASVTPQQGQEVAKKCAACHSFEQGGPNKVGPNLFGIVGGKKAHAGNFQYSQAMTSAGGEWTEEDLNKFLFKPGAYIKGTKMTFAGLPKTDERAAVIKYLESLK